MAWISVHDSVIGPKLRKLRKLLGTSRYEALGILTYFWLWGKDNATKDGLILSADEDDIADVIDCGGEGCELDPKDIVQAMFDSGWLDKSENGIYIHDWDTWQEQWYKLKEKREQDARRKRESRRIKAIPARPEQEVPGDCPQDSPPVAPEEKAADVPTDSPPDSPKTPQETPAYPVPFEDWWAVYPRKVDKGAAYKKYKARRGDGFSDAELMEAARNYALQCKKLKTEKQYIKHPKTFLSETLPFTDYIDRKKPQETEEAPNTGNPFMEYGGDSV